MRQSPCPKISIIIPTRNGIRYLPYAIDSVLSQKDETFELIISDNHSSDGTAEFLRSIDDPRCRIVRPPSLLSMVEHFEFALATAQGDWVTTLGDDDGIMPFFFENLRRLRLDDIRTEAIVFRRAYYFWDGCGELHGDVVVINYPFPRRCYTNNKWSLFLCTSSIIDYMRLPQAYTTGLVRRRYIEKIKAKTEGIFFHGEAPDAASAVALSLHARDHHRVEEPIFWTGTSPKSTGFSQASSQDKTRAVEFDQLNEAVKLPQQNKLPQPLISEFDFTVIFYEALLRNPATGDIWSSVVIRYFFFAGLVLKDRKYIQVLRQSYGRSFRSWALPPFVAILRLLKRRHIKSENRRYMSDKSLSVHSSDRALFPTMREASAAVLDRWHRLHARH